MKKNWSLLFAAILVFATKSFGQPMAIQPTTEGFHSGQVVMRDNSTVSAAIKDNIRKKGEILVLENGKKTKYAAADLKSVRIGSTDYVTHNYGFYEVAWQGNSITLLRKANEPAAIQYAGNEPIAISTEGSVDDYFIKKNGSAPVLLTNKNYKEVLAGICATCATSLEPGKLDIGKIKNLLPDCEKCN